jgi:Domain of unknown function (DUF932)
MLGAGNETETVRDTLWAAYNGVTDLLDHRAPRLKPRSDTAAAKHLQSIWFGQAANLKARAFRRATELIASNTPS